MTFITEAVLVPCTRCDARIGEPCTAEGVHRARAVEARNWAMIPARHEVIQTYLREYDLTDSEERREELFAEMAESLQSI